MKKILLLLSYCIISVITNAEVHQITSSGTRYVVTTRASGVRINHNTIPIDCPDVFYTYTTNTLTIDFGTQPVNDFTVTISSPLTDVDYYVTSSFTTIPLAVDGISDYSIIIESCYGDVFEGTLAASEYASNELF